MTSKVHQDNMLETVHNAENQFATQQTKLISWKTPTPDIDFLDTNKSRITTFVSNKKYERRGVWKNRIGS